MAIPSLLLDPQAVISLGNAFIVALPATILALAGLITAIKGLNKTDIVKTMVNGRMDELLRLTREDAHKNGREAGIKEIVENGQPGVIQVPVEKLKAQNSNLSGELIIRDRETNHIICRRHPDDPEVEVYRKNQNLVIEG